MLKLDVESVGDFGNFPLQGRPHWLTSGGWAIGNSNCRSFLRVWSRQSCLVVGLVDLNNRLICVSFDIVAIVFALQVSLVSNQRVFVGQIVVMNPSQSFLQMMSSHALQAPLDPEDNRDSNNEHQHKDDKAKLGCRCTASWARREPKTGHLRVMSNWKR